MSSGPLLVFLVWRTRVLRAGPKRYTGSFTVTRVRNEVLGRLVLRLIEGGRVKGVGGGGEVRV